MAINVYLIRDKIKDHFRDNTSSYISILITAIVAIVLGVYICLTSYNYTAFLKNADKNMLDYITGTAEISSIFYARLLDCVLCLLMIFVFNLTYYTCFLNYMFLCYQMVLIVMHCGAVISVYGFAGIINVILFIVPINILNFAAMVLAVCFAMERSKLQNKYKLPMSQSFKESNFFVKYILSFVIMLAICVIHSILMPLIVKSFVIISF